MHTEQSSLATTAGEETLTLITAGQPEIFRTVIGQAEKGMIRKALEITNGNISAAAAALDITRLTLSAKIKLHELRHLCRSTGEHNSRHFATKKAIACANAGETA